MSYLIYNSSSSRYPIRQFINPISVKSPDALSTIGTFNYSSNGDTNDFIYYLGTRGGAFTNPHTTGLITVSGTGVYGGGYDPSYVTDRNSNTEYFSAQQDNPYIQIDFKNRICKITRFSYQVGSSNFGIHPLRILGSNDGVNFTTIVDNITANGSANTWVTPAAFSNTNFYRYYRFMRVINNSLLTCKEIQLYGEMSL